VAKIRKVAIILLVIALLVTGLTGCQSLKKYDETREMMSTFVKVAVYAKDKATAEKALNAAFDRMQQNK